MAIEKEASILDYHTDSKIRIKFKKASLIKLAFFYNIFKFLETIV